MDHRPSSQFQLKSQVCLKMIHKDGLTCQKVSKDCLQILCLCDSNFVPKKRSNIFW